MMDSPKSIFYSPLKKEILYFLHIPKTAGTTFSYLLEDLFDKDSIMPEKTWHSLLLNSRQNFNFRLITGHFGYGICRLLKKEPMCIAFLRDPIERTRSYFDHFALQSPTSNNQLSDNFLKKDDTLSNVLANDNKKKIFWNNQTRYIAADFDPSELKSRVKGKNEGILEEYEQFLSPKIPNEDLIKKAKERLSKFAFFGIVERFEESLQLFYYVFGVKPRKINWKLMNTGKTKVTDIPKGTIKLIKENNTLDFELYNYAKSLFDKRYNQMIQDLKEQFYESQYDSLSTKEVIYEMLVKHYQQCYNKSTLKSEESIQLDFSKGIFGSGLYYRESTDENSSFRWTGPETTSSLDLLLKKEKDHKIKFYIDDFVNNDTSWNIKVLVNDNPIDIIIEKLDKKSILKGFIPKLFLQSENKFTRLSFVVDKNEEIFINNPPFFVGKRKVGFAISKIEISVLREATEELIDTFGLLSKNKLELHESQLKLNESQLKLEKTINESQLKLEKTINESQLKLDELQSKLDELQSENNNKAKELTLKDSQIQELQSAFFTIESELSDIKNSFSFKNLSKLFRTIDKVFPSSTKRGEALRLAKTSISTWQNQGFNALTQASAEKIRRSRNFKEKQSVLLKKKKQKNLTIKSNLEKIKSSSPIIFHPKTISDLKLRKNIETDSTNILKLDYFPKVSIIICTYDQLDFLKKNLHSIENKSTYNNYEIIIVTNNLDENSEMRKFLKNSNYTFFVYPKEYSFGGINNYAAKKATGEFLLFMNDDVQVFSPNWLEALVKLGLQEKVGAVGAKLLFPGGKLQEAGGIIWNDGVIWNYGRGENPDDPKFNYVRDVDYCSGSCMLVKKDYFKKLGGFDKQFHPAYCEDSDLCFSLQKLGYKIKYQPLATLIHHEGSSHGTDTNSGIKSFQISNIKKFKKKWKSFLEARPENISNVYQERNRNSGMNILYIDHYVPQYDKDAGSLTAYYVLSILSYLGHNVTFWPDNLYKDEPYVKDLQQRGIEVIYGQNDFEQFLKERDDYFQICIVSRPHVASKYIEKLKKYAPNCIIIYESVDLSYIREFRKATLDNNKKHLKKADNIKQFELEIMKKSDIVSVKSENEAELLLKENPSFVITIIPPLQIVKENTPKFNERKDLIFIGGFQHPPNVDSIEFLIKDIFPKIQKKLPDINLYVIGSNPTENVKELCSKKNGVKFLGYVHNVEPYLEKSRILLAPLRFGAGVKGKITQSMAFGLPVVTTTIGAEGISKDAEVILISDDIDDFVEKTVSLYNDEKKWDNISLNSKKLCNSLFSPETVRSTLLSIIKLSSQ